MKVNMMMVIMKTDRFSRCRRMAKREFSAAVTKLLGAEHILQTRPCFLGIIPEQREHATFSSLQI